MPPKGKQRSKPEKRDSSSGESFENITLASALDSVIQDGAGGGAATVTMTDAVQQQPALEAAPAEPAAAASAAAEAAARAAGAAAGEDSQADPMRELEEATARAAEQAMVAARQAAKGLSAAGGWLSGLVKSGLQAVQAEIPSSPSAVQEAEGLRRQLGLPEGEAVLESFSCQLLQTYEPRNNAFTPTRFVAFPGHLHVASNHLCFVASTTIAVVPVMRVAAADLRGVTKDPSTAALPARLVLGLAPRLGQTLVFTHFELKELELDSCQALLQKVLDTPRGQD